MEYNNKDLTQETEVITPGNNTPMSKRSRLNKRLEKRSRQTIILSILGLVIFIALVLKFGIPFVADLGFFASKVASTNQKTSTVSNKIFIPIPSIDPTFSATNSATIKITGNAPLAKKVQLYLNGTDVKDIEPDDNGTFEAKITLSDGSNIIKAKSISDNSESDFSDETVISLKNSSPTLTIASPSDGQNFSGGSGQITISGNTDPDNQVTVNGFWAIVDSNGNFNYNLKLNGGDNEIKVIAKDNVGNITEKDLKVTYSQ